MKEHKIGWVNIPGYSPFTWNPTIGCLKISDGCKHCYAETMALRLSAIAETKAWDQPMDMQGIMNYTKVVDNKHGGWNGTVRLVPNALDAPLTWKKPRAVFVNSMSDLFYDGTPFGFIDRIMARMLMSKEHIFLILTKRPHRMYEYFNGVNLLGRIISEIESIAFENANLSDKADELVYSIVTRGLDMSNIWLGATVENMKELHRMDDLLRLKAGKHFVSIEPALENIDLEQVPIGNEIRLNAFTGISSAVSEKSKARAAEHHKLDWVLMCGETGPLARPLHPMWARFTRDQCQKYHVPFFFKQWGTWYPYTSLEGKQVLPDSEYHPASKHGFKRVSRKMSAMVDGKAYHEFPEMQLQGLIK